MKTTAEIENKLKQLKPVLSSDFAVKKIGYFGSYAEQAQTESSDLDILVEFSKPVGWNFFTLEKFLEEQFDLKIDLVTHNALKEQFKEKILSQVHYV
jgi:predicted nucleotidyltransferase